MEALKYWEGNLLRYLIICGLLAVFSLFVACSESGSSASSDLADTEGNPVEAGPSFTFDWSSSSIARSPFPNNLHIGEDGKIKADPLTSTPEYQELGRSNILEMIDGYIAQREGFGFSSAIFFPIEAAVDLNSFEGKVKILALDGPEEGRQVASELFWSPYLGALGVFPEWGDYLMPGTTYAVWIEEGPTTADGVPFALTEGFQDLVSDESGDEDGLEKARAHYASFREYLSQSGASASSLLVGTVFTTETSMGYLQGLLEGVDAYELPAPTRAVRWDVETGVMVEGSPVLGEGLSAYFGIPEAPFMNRPGRWDGGARGYASLIEGVDENYEGGTLHQGIAEVHHGSFMAPALNFAVVDGKPKNVGFAYENGSLTWTLDAMIPFTLFLCDPHAADPSNLPVAIFTHGGTSDRTDAIGYATMNCLEGVATIALDMPFHAGRSKPVLNETETLVLPSRIDAFNIFTGLNEGQPGFVPDHVGDNPGAVDTAGNLFGIVDSNDPLVMEANLLMFSLDTYVLTRHLKDSDWSAIREGLSFDSENFFHDSLSFGTTLTTALWAGPPVFKAIFNGVGASYLYSANLTVAPSNGRLASSVVQPLLGLKTSPAELQEGAYRDPVVSLLQWLSQRGDASAYAPYVLRHRQDDSTMQILGVGNSWDQTLSSWAQYSYNVAIGYELFRLGEDWTIDPTITDVPAELGNPASDSPLTGNLEFGDQKHTAGMYFSAHSCHALQVKPICSLTYELAYPPITDREENVAFDSPICGYQNQARHFLKTALAGAAEIIAPGGDCTSLYGTGAP